MIESEDFLKKQIITYIGNKRKLLSFIEEGFSIAKKSLGKEKLSMLDGFSGSGIVGRFMKQHASIIYSVDMEKYSYVLNRCYLTNPSEDKKKEIKEVIDEINNGTYSLSESEKIISDLYSPVDEGKITEKDRVFYTRENAEFIDKSRRFIDDSITHDPDSYYYIAPLLVKASIHANTSGLFKGFYKNKDGIGQFGGEGENCLNRIKAKIKLDYPVFSNFDDVPASAYRDDINNYIENMAEVDLAYFDPPYNVHPYGSNYFMLNIIAEYKRPEIISRVSGIPVDWNKSDYNKRKSAELAFDHLISNTKAKFVLVSYNNESIVPHETMKSILSKYGSLTVLEKDYTVFRGGRKITERESSKVVEYLYVLKK